MIGELVRLDSDINIVVLLLARDTELASISARISLSVENTAIASRAHHLTYAGHLGALVRRQIDWNVERIASVVVQGGDILAVSQGSADSNSRLGTRKYLEEMCRHCI